MQVKNLPWIENPFILWNLEDMLKIAAERFIHMGQLSAIVHRDLDDLGKADEPIIEYTKKAFVGLLNGMKTDSDKLQLKVSFALISKAIDQLSQPAPIHAIAAKEKLKMLLDAVDVEIKAQLFLYILPHRSTHYEYGRIFKERLIKSFPNATKELIRAGRCYAVEEDTACVFHSMRATEMGLRTLAQYLKVHPPKGILFSQWGELIIEIEKKLNQMRTGKKNRAIETRITFCSDALAQFKNLKDAYRNHVVHARVGYEADQLKT